MYKKWHNKCFITVVFFGCLIIGNMIPKKFCPKRPPLKMVWPKRPWPKHPSPKRPRPKRPWPKRPTFGQEGTYLGGYYSRRNGSIYCRLISHSVWVHWSGISVEFLYMCALWIATFFHHRATWKKLVILDVFIFK